MSRRTIVKLEIAFLLAIPTWALLLSCAGLGPDSFSTVYLIAYFYLVTGWAFFLLRVLPNVTVDWSSVGLAVACLFGLVFGLHFFCAWLYREIAQNKASQKIGTDEQTSPLLVWRFRTTLSILAVVVLLFVAGISVVGGVHQLVWLRTRQ